MSRIRANTITNNGANGAPDFPNGITVTGVVTATTLNQTLNGDLTVTGHIGVGGTLTYEDVTNIDSIGIVTARTGIKIGPSAGVAGTFYADGSYRTSGIVTATEFYGGGGNLTGIDATQIQKGNTSVQTVDTGSDGHVKINTEGSERVRVGAAGSVGIGTDDPYSPLSIYGDTAAGTFINITSRTNTLAGINFGDFDDQDIGAIKYSNGSNTLRIFANSGERFRIGEAGQLGIGGATYGSSGQVLTSGGASAAPTWGTNAGKIVQWKWGDSGGNIINNVNQTWTDTDSFAEMTPTSSSSRMMAIVFGHHDARSPYHVSVQWRIRRTHSPKGSGNSTYYGNDWLTNRSSDLGIYSASNVWNMGTGQSNSTDYQYRVQVVCDSSSPGNVRFHQYCRMLLLEMVDYA